MLHTGDKFCLTNPSSLRKMTNLTMKREILQRYLLIFINLYEQEAQTRQASLVTNLTL